MLDLTPGERRGALTLLVLLLLGTAQDLWHARRPPVGLPAHVAGPTAVVNPAGESVPSTGSTQVAPFAPTAPIDLNRATVEELDGLPGIGPVLAGRIVAHRSRVGRFHSREDLFAVQGIGPKLFARLAPLVSVGPPGGTAGNPDDSAAPSRAERSVR